MIFKHKINFCDLLWPLRSYLILWKICVLIMLAYIEICIKIYSWLCLNPRVSDFLLDLEELKFLFFCFFVRYRRTYIIFFVSYRRIYSFKNISKKENLILNKKVTLCNLQWPLMSEVLLHKINKLRLHIFSIYIHFYWNWFKKECAIKE